MNISEILTHWYSIHRRALPWRETTDPYRIWLSEVILQQTRVNQGIDYYHRFMERYPDVGSLARASLDEVLKSWQGLGYYTRARNLHKTARYIYYECNGKFPDRYHELIRLPGVGDYTASAIASFCFNEVVAVVDGNVARVLTRLSGTDVPINTSQGRKVLGDIAQSLISSDDPATHNQAVIEFGALHCTPRNPGCNECPLSDQCIAWQNGLVNQLPVKQRNRKKKSRYFYYIDINQNGYRFLHKRNQDDIWKSLYQFPMIEASGEMEINQISHTREWQSLFSELSPVVQEITEPYTHILTHQKIIARFIRVEIDRVNRSLEECCRRVPQKDLETLAVPRLIERYMEEENNAKKG